MEFAIAMLIGRYRKILISLSPGRLEGLLIRRSIICSFIRTFRWSFGHAVFGCFFGAHSAAALGVDRLSRIVQRTVWVSEFRLSFRPSLKGLAPFWG
jgi:hypothetical protein